MKVESCKFFAKGHCARGSKCYYQHETDTSNKSTVSKSNLETASWRAAVPVADKLQSSLQAAAAVFTPSLTAGQDKERSLFIPCRFFAKGFCKNGGACPYKHVLSSDVTAEIHQTVDSSIATITSNTLEADLKSLSIGDHICTRNFKGAEVTYGNGAKIASILLHTDFSAVQISGLTAESRLEHLQAFLLDLGFPMPLEKFRSKSLSKGEVIVEIKMQDPEFARKLVAKFGQEVGKGRSEEIEIKQLQVGTENRSLSANRLQMSSVICSWFKDSITAWLHYSKISKARQAEQILKKHGKILERKVQIKLSPFRPSDRQIITVEVGNLDPSTRKTHFKYLQDSGSEPTRIIFGQRSREQSDSDAENIVRELLLEEGMESWESISTPGAAQAKASARFGTREAAAQAVRRLNKKQIGALGNSQIFLSHMSSVKFSVPAEMIKVLEDEISEMQLRLKESGHTHLRSYPPAQLSSPYIVIRISGQDLKEVARTKSDLERILKGHVLEADGSFVWDPHFGTALGLAYLRELHASNSVFIHRDVYKQRLAIYGTPQNIDATKDALRNKIRALSELTHTITLTPDLLQKALSGGWQAILHKFGKGNVTLDIAHQPKTIKICGSLPDYEAAKALLLANYSKPGDDQELDQTCAICWGEAEDPFDTPCHHTYCTECLINQCVSASEKDIPIRCHGDSANCTHVFMTTDLQKVLPSATFERLLETSFESHVRSHPKEFQHCPTADCPQIFRISSNGINFDCPACLGSICTTCALISHEGFSCKEYKELVLEGDKAFREYKAKNDIKDCPKCGIAISKTDGCNHMKCIGCHAHICWFCMEYFGSGKECYDHMSLQHRGFYGT